jgi:protein involved in polysaccharide export with SLBB domain
MPVPPGYVIGPGDVLHLTVVAKERTQIDRDYPVSAEGFIFLPQIGRVTAAGQRVSSLQGAVSEAYRQYYIDPQVTLVVSQQRVVEVYVTGEAQRPGKYVLTGMATVFSALYAAGGPSEIGTYRSLKLTRVGKPALTIDLYDYLMEGTRDGDVVLEPGDTLFIPPLEAEVGLAGEVRREGRYEMKGTTTVEQALAMAGGMTPTGYAPRVKLWRMDATRQWQLTDLDLSQPGGKDGATALRDGDLLEVPPALGEPMNVAYVMGAVRRPGTYPATPGMTVGGLIAAAQGLEKEASVGLGVVRRLNAQFSYDTLRFNVAEVVAGKPGADLPVQPRDIVQIYWRREVEPPLQVEVQGAVARPGVYDWVAKMRVSQLILTAGGLVPGAYVEEAKLERVRPDQRREQLTVDVAAALAGEGDADLVLERGDILRIKTRAEALPASTVQIEGYVKNPGEYPRLEGMRVSDLIFAAGGLLPEAGPTVELTPGRYLGEAHSVTLQLTGSPDAFKLEPDPVLRDDDSVGVASQGSFVARAGMASLAGEVERPGAYAIKGTPGTDQYTVWDLLQEGGALLPDANPRGMVLYRMQGWQSKAQGDDLSKVLQAINTEARETAAPVSSTAGVGTPQQTAALSQTVAQGVTSVLAGTGRVTIILPPQPVSAEHAVTGIPIDGDKLLQSKGQQGNVVLQNGDMVVVPKRPTTVTVLGAVARPGAIPVLATGKVQDYLALAGGLREDAADDRMIVVHANGGAAPARAKTLVLAGDVVVVPTRHVVRNIRTQSELVTWLQSIVPVITAALVLHP